MPEFKRGATNLTLVFKKSAILNLRTSSASGAVSSFLLLYREPDAFESVSSPVGPLTASFTQPPTAYVGTTPFSSTLLIPAIEQIRQAVMHRAPCLRSNRNIAH